MSVVADRSRGAAPQPRLVLARNGGTLRAIGLAGLLALLALAVGGSCTLGLMLASSVVLVVLVERAVLCREGSAKLQIATSAARIEGQRDAIAQVMSLELAYERSRSVLEALREGVVVIDEAGEIVLANPAARRAMRQSTREVVGQTLWHALAGDLAGRAREAFDALHDPDDDGGDDALPQIRYSGILGNGLVFDLTAVRATSRRTGQDFGTVFLFVDTTRTHELQRIKDRFLSNVSHELRTPLTNICAYAEILGQMDAADEQEWPEFVRIIHDEGVELSELVDAMFDFLQLESGEAEFDNEVVDGAAIVREVVAARSGKADARGIEVAVEIDDDVPELFVDARRLQQVVRHLLDNAIKFGAAGGRVLVAARTVDAGFELRIEDNGPGVPEDERQAVFEKFNQLNDDMTDKPSGTGIGLATSRAIVARFGGLIWCEDSPLGGAAFVVLLPAAGQPRLVGFAAGTGAGGGF